jgi:hypothetical protein
LIKNLTDKFLLGTDSPVEDYDANRESEPPEFFVYSEQGNLSIYSPNTVSISLDANDIK